MASDGLRAIGPTNIHVYKQQKKKPTKTGNSGNLANRFPDPRSEYACTKLLGDD